MYRVFLTAVAPDQLPTLIPKAARQFLVEFRLSVDDISLLISLMESRYRKHFMTIDLGKMLVHEEPDFLSEDGVIDPDVVASIPCKRITKNTDEFVEGSVCLPKTTGERMPFYLDVGRFGTSREINLGLLAKLMGDCEGKGGVQFHAEENIAVTKASQ